MAYDNGEFYQPTPKEKEVWKVCDALFKEGIRLTYDSIGHRLLEQGLKRGSNTDICRYLNSWKKHHFPVVHANPTPVSTIQDEPKKTPSEGSLKPYLDMQFSQLQSQINKLKASKSTVKITPSTSNEIHQVIPVLLDIIKRQQGRETHYLKALDHAKDVQSLLKKEVSKLNHELHDLEKTLSLLEEKHSESTELGTSQTDDIALEDLLDR